MDDSATTKELKRSGASLARRYGLTFASVGGALLLDRLFRHFNLPHPFAAFALSAIAIAFWYGGTTPGIVAVLLSSLIRGFLFEGKPSALSRVIYELVFVTFGILMIWVRRRKEALEVSIMDRTAKLTAANEDLLRRKEELDGLFELSPDAVILTDENFSVLRVNKEFTRIFGYTAEESAGRWLPDLIVPEESHAESFKYRDWLISGKRVELEVIRQRKGGVCFDVSVVAKKFALGVDQKAFYLIYRDITERKQAERQLRQSQAYLAEAQRLSHTGSFGWSIPSGELFWSEETFQIFQYEPTTKPTVELFLQRVHPEDAALVKQTVERASQNGKDFEHEYRLLMPDGSVKYVQALAYASGDKSGGIEFVGAVSDVTPRKRAEEAVRKSEERWRSIFENSAVGVALTDMTGRFLATNQVYQTMLGYTEEELRTLQFLDITHEDYREANWALIAELVEGKRRQFQIEKKYRRKDGSSIWVSNNVSLVPGTDRVPRFIMALSEDITQRKRAEDALRRSEAYLAEGQRLAKTGSWAIDPKTERCIYWSEEMRKIFGLDPQSDLPDRERFLRLVHPEDRDGFNERVDNALRAKADLVQDYRIVLPDGTVKHIHGIGHLVLDETGDIIECVGTDVDVTERKRAEEELRRSEESLLEAQRLSHIGSWKHDIATGAVIVSPEIYRIFGVQPDEDISSVGFWLSRNHPEDQQRIQELFARCESQKTDYEADYRIVLPDGTIKHLHAVGHPVLSQSGELVEMIGTAIDVTERKRAEEERERLHQLETDLAHMNRVTMLGELASSLAHELNQPIAAAITSANACLRWLAHNPPDLERARAAVTRIENDGSRAAEIIQRLRAFYKTGAPPKRELVDLNQVVVEMLALLRNEADRHSISLRTKLALQLPQIMADRVQLQQVLMNLLLNGIEAMMDGPGELTVRSQCTEGGLLLISVSDTGVGLPSEHLERLFNAFYTTKPQGTGMGLAISRSIIEAHGGRLWATANAERGATFHFTLPAELQQ
jgi:PAS domain S-box-containing protein